MTAASTASEQLVPDTADGVGDPPDQVLKNGEVPSDAAPDGASTSDQDQARALQPEQPRHRTLIAGTIALVIGLLGVLLINTVISQGAFRQHQLEVQLILLAEREEALTRAVQQAESPLEIEKKARALGMVPAAAPVFLRLSDGTILGERVPASWPVGKVDYSGAPGPLEVPPEGADATKDEEAERQPGDEQATGDPTPSPSASQDPMADPIIPAPPPASTPAPGPGAATSPTTTAPLEGAGTPNPGTPSGTPAANATGAQEPTPSAAPTPSTPATSPAPDAQGGTTTPQAPTDGNAP